MTTMNEGQDTVTLSPLFGEGGMLQSGDPLRIWGTGRPCSQVRITITDRSADAVVGDDGAWVVQLGPLEPGGPYRLEVRVDGGDEPVIAHDVYAGEVFICAGQSNMEYQMEFLRWLVRLAVPRDGLVVEPFAGSGATLQACVMEGVRCEAAEMDADYIRLIRERMGRDMQTGLF